MKLRNKKSGHIAEVLTDSIKVNVLIDREDLTGYYTSLAELNEEWEDYKEPLIKDEKIRKAVRAWAEANDINPKHYYETDVKFDFMEHQFKWISTSIEFNDITGLENLEDGKTYNIAELCGEDE